LRELALALGALALALLGLGLASRWPGALGLALAALGGEYAVLFAAEGGRLDRYVPVYATGLLFVAELAFWSIERRVPAWSEPNLVERRLAFLIGACVGAAAVAALVTVLAAAAGGGGIVLEAVGVAAVTASLGLLVLLVRRSAPSLP
jgi:hypothetical protein